MGSKSPVFPIAEPQHFSDYGFDPQIDYFQVLEEARKHKHYYCSSSSTTKPAPIEGASIHFKLQKPISKDHETKKSTKKRKWWFKNAILYLKSKWHSPSPCSKTYNQNGGSKSASSTCDNWSSSISGPIYVTESRSGSSTPYRNITSKSRPTSGPLAGGVDVPYLCLKELNDHIERRPLGDNRISSPAPSPMPIYLVT